MEGGRRTWKRTTNTASSGGGLAGSRERFHAGAERKSRGAGLVYEALAATNRLPEGEVIADQLERRARQHLEIADVTKRLRESDAELRFHQKE